MQPILMVSASVPGLVYLNGRSVGETGPEDAISLPVSPRGAVYLELRPLVSGYLPVLRRITLAGGRVLPDSVAAGPGLSVVLWPDSVVDVELVPEPVSDTVADARSGTPDDPSAVRLDDGSVRLMEALDDTVGHARLRSWSAVGGEWIERAHEYMWGPGAPHWPETPEETAMAAAEACLLGLTDEARGYFTPGPSGQAALKTFMNMQADACVRMKYAPINGQSAIGLLTLRGENCAEVTPLAYAAVPMSGPQGMWRLENWGVG